MLTFLSRCLCFTDSGTRIINLSEESSRAELIQQAEEMEEGMILHRLWMGLAVYSVDQRGVKATSDQCMQEGTHYILNGALKGQNGVRFSDYFMLVQHQSMRKVFFVNADVS